MRIETRSYEVAELTADGLKLRPIETSDAQDIYAYACQKKVTRYLLWSEHRNLAETMRFIELTAELNKAQKQMDWAIEDTAAGRMIGTVGAMARSAAGEVMEIGYVLNPAYWDRGIMTRTVRIVADYLFRNTVCHRIFARAVTENLASIGVLERCGFTKEGVQRKGAKVKEEWRDTVSYALLKEDWEAMQPRSAQEGWRKIRAAKCFAFDMDGTVYLGDDVLPGAIELVGYLRRNGVRPVFLTNNSSRSVETYVTRLNGMGFGVTREDILSSGQAAAGYLLRHFPGKRVYVMGNQNLIDEIASFGIEVTEKDAQIVLTGFDTTLNYEKLTVTCDYVRAGLPYIATHPDLNCPVKDGFIPDLGSMTALIEKSAGRLPDVVIGKPHGEIARYLLERTGLQKEEVVMVGDRLYTDIATGVRFGMPTVLVLSGETKKEQLENSTVQPDLVLGGVDELLEGLSR